MGRDASHECIVDETTAPLWSGRVRLFEFAPGRNTADSPRSGSSSASTPPVAPSSTGRRSADETVTPAPASTAANVATEPPVGKISATASAAGSAVGGTGGEPMLAGVVSRSTTKVAAREESDDADASHGGASGKWIERGVGTLSILPVAAMESESELELPSGSKSTPGIHLIMRRETSARGRGGVLVLNARLPGAVLASLPSDWVDAHSIDDRCVSIALPPAVMGPDERIPVPIPAPLVAPARPASKQGVDSATSQTGTGTGTRVQSGSASRSDEGPGVGSGTEKVVSSAASSASVPSAAIVFLVRCRDGDRAKDLLEAMR